jgi:hypothetical protein
VKNTSLALLTGCVMALLLPPVETGRAAAAPRDGRHDFDFNLGTWRIHVERLRQPLAHSNTWVTLEGSKVVRKLWDGKAQLEQVKADGPDSHIENMGVMLYNPIAHQWSVSFASSAAGTLGAPMVGEFSNGRGEFISPDTYQGRAILVRLVWSDFTPATHRLEQAFSEDGGKTWETNLKVALTRVADGPAASPLPQP